MPGINAGQVMRYAIDMAKVSIGLVKRANPEPAELRGLSAREKSRLWDMITRHPQMAQILQLLFDEAGHNWDLGPDGCSMCQYVQEQLAKRMPKGAATALPPPMMGAAPSPVAPAPPTQAPANTPGFMLPRAPNQAQDVRWPPPPTPAPVNGGM